MLNAALPISLFFVFNFSSVQYEAQSETPCGVKAAKRKPIQFVSSPAAMRFNQQPRRERRGIKPSARINGSEHRLNEK